MKKQKLNTKLNLNKQVISKIYVIKGGAAPDNGGTDAVDVYTEARTCREDQLSLPHSQCNCWKF
ncbi:hypothetical protein ACJD0Z_08195 [Flavobacteriaceae bacterium M23B6Z8]